MDATSQARWFFDTVYGGSLELPEQSTIVVCHRTNQGRLQSRACSTPAEAATVAIEKAALDSKPHVYATVGLLPPISIGRGKAKDVLGLTAVAADIDVSGPAHDGKPYPKDIEQAQAIIARCGLLPSFVVHTGHGLQPWWCFVEVLDRDPAVDLAHRWGATLADHAAAADCAIDTVSDPVRLFRVPGTPNNKPDLPPAEAVLLNPPTSVLRYSVDDFEGYIIADAYARRPGNTSNVVVDTLDLSQLHADSPLVRRVAERLAELRELDPEIKSALMGIVPKTNKDQSANGVDLSLADRLALHFTDQEIAAAIWLRRSKAHEWSAEQRNGKTPEEIAAKGRRYNYLAPTIAKAKSFAAQYKVAERVAEGKTEQRNTGESKDDFRRRMIQEWSTAVGFPIQDVKWFGPGDLSHYVLYVDDQEVEFASTEDLLTWSRAEAILFGYLGRAKPSMTGVVWKGLMEKIMRVTKPIPEELAKSSALVRRIILEELETGNVPERETMDGKRVTAAPIIQCSQRDELYVRVNALQKHIRSVIGTPISLANIRVALSDGWTEQRPRFSGLPRASTKVTMLSAWRRKWDTTDGEEHDATNSG
jgi:hypothetical protein